MKNHIVFTEQNSVQRFDISNIVFFLLGGNKSFNQFVNHRIFYADNIVAADNVSGGAAPIFTLFVARKLADWIRNNRYVKIKIIQPVFENINLYQKYKVKAVIGTTGLTNEQIEQIKKMSKENNTGIIIAPNFSIGAILMMKFAAMASKYFSNAEIIEYHHNQKKDAPSGTSIKTAQLMIKENKNFKLGNCPETETIKGSRGGCYEENNEGNIQIHSVRMPGFVASQQVIFGSDGQILKIHHDTINRECYMGGVKIAIEYLYKNNEFVYGLENIL